MTTKYFFHKPVLLAEAIEQLRPKSGSIIVDCTLGGAGHATAIAKAILPRGMLVGLDIDDEAINVAKDVLAPFGQQIEIHIKKASFADVDDVLIDAGTGLVDGFLFDFGISSRMVDDASRGFSYKVEAPLDMRMDRQQELTAEMVVNEYDEGRLEQVIRRYGEEKFARRIASAICDVRKRERIKTTTRLAEIIKEAIPASARRTGPHPAKRSFQAIRIEVNRELENIQEGLTSSINWLKPGGRLVTITYHSLEDRIVKKMMKDWERKCICPEDMPVCICRGVQLAKIITRKPIMPSKREIAENPRARSAKMRVAEKV